MKTNQTTVVTTKGCLYGYESDLKLNRYAVTMGVKADVLGSSEEFVWRTDERDKAVAESELWAADLRMQRGKNRSKVVRVYAIRQYVCGDISRDPEEAELIATCEKYKRVN